jgi:hypothetical protein
MTIAGERHSTVKMEAYTRGLRAVFAKELIALSPSQMQEYEGRYKFEFNPGNPIFIQSKQRLLAWS